MIGKVLFLYHDAFVEAILADNGSWTCDAVPCLVRPLDVLYSPRRYRPGEPDDGRAGALCLAAAARWLNGIVLWAEFEPDHDHEPAPAAATGRTID